MNTLKSISVILYIILIAENGYSQFHQPDLDSLDYYYKSEDWSAYFRKLKLLGDSAILLKNSKERLKEIEPFLFKVHAYHDVQLKLMLRKAYTQYALRYNKLGDFNTALKWYLKAHDLVDDPFCLDDWAWYVENEIASIYTRFDDFEKAEYFSKLTENSLRYYSFNKWLSRLCTNLGTLYESKKDLYTAKSYFEKGLAIAKNLDYTQGIIACATGLGEINIYMEDHIQAVENLKMAMSSSDLIDTLDQHYYENKLDIHKSLANLYRIQKDSFNALMEFQLSLKYMKLFYSDTIRREFGKIYCDIARFYYQHSDYKLSEKFIEKGIQSLLPDAKSVYKPPLLEHIYQENTFTDLFLLCSELFHYKYKKDGNQEYQKICFSYLDLGLRVNEKIRNSLLADPSKLINIESNKKLVDLGIQYLFEFWSLQKDDEIWNKARQYFDKSKSILLKEKDQDLKVLEQLNSNDKIKIKLLEEKELELCSLSASRINKDSVNQELFKTQSEIKDIFSKYQKKLTKTIHPENYIEYNVQDTFIYMVASLGSQKYFERIGTRSELQNIYTKLNGQLLNYDDLNSIEVYKQAYQFLLGLLRANLPDRITIIPDGNIQFIPFEMLKNGNGEFLVNRTTISYSNTYEQTENELDYSDKSIFIYAIKPVYLKIKTENKSLNRGNVSPLFYTEEEINELRLLYGKNIMVDSSNNKSNIISKMRSAQIVHYAGHAEARGDSAFLILPGNENNLSLDEIKSIKNPLKMLVLSACETGLGEWEQGEGIRSLGKCFQESGAESVIISLWAVNDESTAKIMSAFYRNLNNGLPKDESLKNAKLEYIKNSSLERKYPYYWAGLVAFGDISPINKPSNTNIIIFSIIGLCLSLITTIIYSKYFKQNIS